jgi:hypothetical protein
VTRETYQKRLERHLAEYKRHRLGVSQKGQFTYKGVAREYGHILPRELKWLNVPEPFRREIVDYVARHGSIQPHKYFHHLNSSQALAFALLYPYVTNAPRVLARGLGMKKVVAVDPMFELVPDSEEGTNVDVSWTCASSHVYCEVKLSEREFGAAKADARHRQKLSTIYEPVLRDQIEDALLEEAAFFKHYQILRNLWLVARRGHERDQVVFLMPQANTVLTEQLSTVLSQVGRPLRARVQVVYLESLLARLAQEKAADGLAWYARMLQEKYVPS